jgi:hypothetical protein
MILKSKDYVRNIKLNLDINIYLILKYKIQMSTFKKEKAPLKPTRKARNELTEEQKQEIKEAFDLFDTESVGKIYIHSRLY